MTKLQVTRRGGMTVVRGDGFENVLSVPQPGVVVMRFVGLPTMATTAPEFAFIEAEAARSGRVLLLNDVRRAGRNAPGVVEAWTQFLTREPHVVRESLVLVGSATMDMSVNVMRLDVDVSITSFARREDFDAAVRAQVPGLDASVFDDAPMR